MEETQELSIPAGKALAETLKLAQEKSLPVIVILGGGLKYSGRVKDISANAVVIWRVAGKENYDNYIPLSSVTAVEFEVRVGK